MKYAPTAITDQLWVGAHPPREWLASAGRKFAVIAFCALELPPPGSSPRYLNVGLTDDDMVLKHPVMLDRAVKAAKALIAAKGPALCVCAAGRNRSAFVAALSLVMAGVSPAFAIGRVRLKRELDLGESVLFNCSFIQVLREWPRRQS